MILVLAGCATRAEITRSAATTAPSSTTQYTTAPIDERTVRRPSIERAITDGVAFLVKSQNADGSWGTGTETRGTEIYSMVPGSHDAYRVGTTALCVMALREATDAGYEDAQAAHRKALEYLITHGEARRDKGDLLYNIWAHLYAVQAIAIEMRTNSDPRLKSAAVDQLNRMNRYATYAGGWNYYDFGARTQQASMGATSFGTAAGLVALYEARKVGVAVPQRLVDMSLRRLEECRLPNGVFSYGVSLQYAPRLPGNMVRGAAGRTQPANFALWIWSSKLGGEKPSLQGLDLFFQEHIYLDMARKRPFPHETWYQNSGYYYYFDHYYAARLVEKLSHETREKYATQLAEHVLPHQESDGSWWDYAMWDYHKSYGTAFAIMTLLRCR